MSNFRIGADLNVSQLRTKAKPDSKSSRAAVNRPVFCASRSGQGAMSARNTAPMVRALWWRGRSRAVLVSLRRAPRGRLCRSRPLAAEVDVVDVGGEHLVRVRGGLIQQPPERLLVQRVRGVEERGQLGSGIALRRASFSRLVRERRHSRPAAGIWLPNFPAPRDDGAGSEEHFRSAIPRRCRRGRRSRKRTGTLI